MNFSSESREVASIEGGVVRDSYAAVYSQLQHTVQRLVQVALENARAGSEPGPLVLRPAAVATTRADSTLSVREREVLQRIVAGDSNKMIARVLGLSPHTVKRHVANILDKIGARSRAQAAAWLLAHH